MKTISEVLGGYPGLSVWHEGSRPRLARTASRVVLTAGWDPDGAIGVVAARPEASDPSDEGLEGRWFVSAVRPNSGTRGKGLIVTAALRGVLEPLDLEVDPHQRADLEYPVWLRLPGEGMLTDEAAHMRAHADHIRAHANRLAVYADRPVLGPVDAGDLGLASYTLMGLARGSLA